MHARAIEHLKQCDPVMREWVERLGVIKIPRRRSADPYLALLKTIVYQQLAGAAAEVIWSRVVALFEDGEPHPERMMAIAEERLRGAGLSRSKAAAMKDIAAKRLAGLVPEAHQLQRMADEDIHRQLQQIRGVGPWTVEMLLMFTLRRPDVFSTGDYGLRKGFQLMYGKRALPTPQQVSRAAEAWRPYRTYAALYLWQIADTRKPAPRKPARRKKRRRPGTEDSPR